VEEKKIISVVDYIVTKTVINNKTTVHEVGEFLRTAKATGKVQFDVSRGGSQRYLLTQESKLTEAQSSAIREMLGWSENKP
jgi:hypothetical protein